MEQPEKINPTNLNQLNLWLIKVKTHCNYNMFKKRRWFDSLIWFLRL